MEPNFYQTSTPIPMSTNYQDVTRTESSLEKKTKEAAKFTQEAAEMTFSPKFSFFLQGCALVMKPSSGGYLGGLDQGLGALLIMASPFWFLFRVVVGLPSTVAGAVATSVLGVSTAVDHTAKAVGEGLSSQTTKERTELTRKFINRMHKLLEKMEYFQKKFFKEHPAALVSVAALSVAFLSRNAPHNQILVQKRVLKLEDLQNYDQQAKDYFVKLHEVKKQIFDLHLSLDDQIAWQYLTTITLDLKKNTPQNTTMFALDEDHSVETIKDILEQLAELGENVVNDKTFQRLWQDYLRGNT